MGPKMLSQEHKSYWEGASMKLFHAYSKDGDSLLDRIVTGDETYR